MRRHQGMNNKMKKILATVMTGVILCAGVPEMGADAGSMKRTMNWTVNLYSVTISNSWSEPGYGSCNTLKLRSGANNTGNLLVTHATDSILGVAWQELRHKNVKSAEAWHMAKYGSKTVQLKVYYRNKGVNYKYN